MIIEILNINDDEYVTGDKFVLHAQEYSFGVEVLEPGYPTVKVKVLMICYH